MTDQRMYPHEIQCAQRMDGHQYQRKHPTYNFTEALTVYRETGQWEHLSIPEAMATMSMLCKALQTWERSPYPSPENLAAHYQAFHSLYELLKNIPMTNP
jgi:hypothetical protein